MKVISRVCVFLCCLSVALPALAQPSREHRRGEGARAEMRERREALRDMAARMESAGKSRDLAALKEQQPLLEARYEALRKVLETAF